jgi:hypothetical protein
VEDDDTVCGFAVFLIAVSVHAQLEPNVAETVKGKNTV